MIVLEIEGYCESCLDFFPDVKRPERIDLSCLPTSLEEKIGEESLYTDTIIKCSNRKRCEAIKRYLEKELEKDGDT